MFIVITLLISLLITPTVIQTTTLQEEQITRWAEKIGNDLWNLGTVTTKVLEIREHYLVFNAQVEEKNLEDLILEVGKDIERMMDRKSDAIKCMVERAEVASQNHIYNNSMYQYYSSKYSNEENKTGFLPEILKGNKDMYLNLTLNNDTHFYNLPVDTTRSSVHVPTNIYDRHEDAAFAIQWSEELDEVFVQNYNSDPGLSWQYFCSAAGVMRHYPAKKWPEIEKDEFDCRVRTWYIEAATCTKDVIIVVDNSGSMDGMGKHIATLTVNTILDTFSNNDYTNILYYTNETTNYTIPCFAELLVQATPENINLFKMELAEKDFFPSGKTDLPQALQTAFDILREYRVKRGCGGVDEDGKSKSCNQAIMLITDGIIRNLSDIVIRNNHLDGGTNIPVRLFTYLIGKEATNVEEIRWMACANRGFYTQVQTLEQVTYSVLQYINVIARPLVLQGEDHPISWTHAYLDTTYDEERDDSIRLLTSAAVPAFDKKSNQNNATRVANLLGVAGTDVPIDEIEKLTLPYKLGVNAYAFIISNNGYVLMHRDFRPMFFYEKFKGHLRKNYNSIDLVEIEEFDEELPPREIPKKLKELRNNIVSGAQGNMLGIPIKYHYDKMRRVTRDNYDFYYVPLNQTPFSLGFAVPDGYGHFSLQVDDVINSDKHKPGVRISNYFEGSNWKIHPKWVYCRYHYLEGHEFATPENETFHFLEKLSEDDFTWEKQYEEGAEELEKVDCGRKTHGDDDYYCDEHLMQRLVFDAKNTHEAFQGSWKDTDKLFKEYNATLRFVATMSGLTRWEYISEEVERNSKNHEFGDLHSEAIDETWYQSAVIQFRYDPEAFVFSVPFHDDEEEKKGGLLITASYAVFPTDAENKAPGCVVGYQFAHKNFLEIVQDLTASLSNECVNCGTCNTTLTCYVVDNDGYVIASLSEDSQKDTGRFFGEIEGDIMNAMVNHDPPFFEKMTIYDYQAVCSNIDDGSSDANILFTPIHYIKTTIHWLFMKLIWFFFEMNIFNIPIFAEETEQIIEGTPKRITIEYYECEQYRHLYMLQQKIFKHSISPGEVTSPNSRTFFLNKIPHTNLIFIAINNTMPLPKPDLYPKHTTAPKKIEYNDSLSYSCQKLELNNLTRRRLAGCYNEDPLEKEITVCGRSTNLQVYLSIIILAVLLLVM